MSQMDFLRPINIEALLVQALGGTSHLPCDSCLRGNGHFVECKTMEGMCSDACANCAWGSCGNRCQFYIPTRKRRGAAADTEDRAPPAKMVKPTPAAKSATKSTPKPAPKPAPEPAPEPVPEPAPELAAKPAAKLAVKPAAKTQSASVVQPLRGPQ